MMGYGQFRNGRHQPITPRAGSWAAEQNAKRGFRMGPELQVGDVIRFWTNGNDGMRVEKIMPYTGKYPEICCSVAILRGIAGKKEGLITETTIEHNARYELLEDAV
jgi:hypothetical protein